MDKLQMHTANQADENVKHIFALFPNTLTERKNAKGETELAIDFDVLKQELSKVIVEGREERYQFNWPDKKKSVLLANAPISDTLRPCSEESVDFDATENLYIEGDNLNVLKLLQETYLCKVKMIYIDPPYNTGNDSFVYDDNYSMLTADFTNASGQYDENGNLLFEIKQNNETNGRYHTDWLNMMYPRLKLSRDLLTDDGVIFISIDENELANLKRISDEIYGEKNCISIISRVMKSGGNNGEFFSPNIDYILVYAKNIMTTVPFKGELSDELIKNVYNKTEKTGTRAGEKYRTMGLYQASLTLERSSKARYYIDCPDGTKCIPPAGKRWRVIESSYHEMLSASDIEFIETKQSPLIDQNGAQSNWNIYTKIWLDARLDEGQKPNNLIVKYENRHSSKELQKLGIPFDFAKYSELIKYLISIINQDDSITVLDFFSGSATTAHAVMQLNAEDGGKRKFIMVQLPELTDEKSEAYKAGYKNICEIGKERIRRAGAKIKAEIELTTRQVRLDEEPRQIPDIGFRVLKLDSSNMKDVYYTPEEYTQLDLSTLADNIKEDRTPEDLLFQVMLELGVLLSSPIEASAIAGKKVFRVADNFLIACFDKDITNETVTAIARLKPYYAVFRDSSYASDAVAVNFEQIFAAYSPDTVRRVL